MGNIYVYNMYVYVIINPCLILILCLYLQPEFAICYGLFIFHDVTFLLDNTYFSSYEELILASLISVEVFGYVIHEVVKNLW